MAHRKMNTFARRILNTRVQSTRIQSTRIQSTRILDPTPLTWVYMLPCDLRDYLSSPASDEGKCRTIQKEHADCCVYYTRNVNPQLLVGPGTVWCLELTYAHEVIVAVVTQTTYEDGMGGSDEPGEFEDTDEQIRWRQ